MLTLNDVSIATSQSWAFVGANGGGKSALARALAGELALLAGERRTDYRRIARLSLEQVQRLVEEEWQRDNTDLLSPGEDDTGSTAAEIIQQQHHDNARCQILVDQFGISQLLTRRFKYLSTGESRKVLLCQALMARPDLLILDEPFDGLDVASREQLSERLAGLADNACTLVLILNRFEDIPDYIDRVGILVDCVLTCTGSRQSLLAKARGAQLAHLKSLQDLALPKTDSPPQQAALPAD